MKMTGRCASSLSRLRRLQVSKPSDARHQRVHEHQVGRDLADELQSRLAVGRDQHREAGAIQRVGEQAQGLRRVVDDQDGVAPHRGGLRHLHAWSPARSCSASGRNCDTRMRSCAANASLAGSSSSSLAQFRLDSAHVADAAEPVQVVQMMARRPLGRGRRRAAAAPLGRRFGLVDPLRPSSVPTLFEQALQSTGFTTNHREDSPAPAAYSWALAETIMIFIVAGRPSALTQLPRHGPAGRCRAGTDRSCARSGMALRGQLAGRSCRRGR